LHEKELSKRNDPRKRFDCPLFSIDGLDIRRQDIAAEEDGSGLAQNPSLASTVLRAIAEEASDWVTLVTKASFETV
jgi:hypothetical protein